MKDMLLSDQTLFRNEEVFDPRWLPEEILYRDSQMKEMALSIKPALRGGRASNCVITGPVASGKTSCAKFMVKEIKGEKKVAPVHMNCEIYDTPFKIFSEIHAALFGFRPPETGVPLNAVYDKIFSFVSKEKKTLLVVLDEASAAPQDAMYKILRAHETHPDVKTCLWLISPKDFIHRLDDKVRSAFMPNFVRFGRYTARETSGILKARCDAGLYNGVVSGEVIEAISSSASDLRHAIEILRKSVVAAESDAAKKVSMKHVEKFIGATEIILDEDSITNALKKGPVDSGRLFSSTGMSYSKFYRTLKKMEAAGKICITPDTKGRGKTSIISLR